jgi:hypothetical protein
MHPDLCRYTSAAFYDGKLGGVGGLGGQEIQGWGSGLCLVEVPHQGNTNASPEEAREVARLAEQLTGRRWRDNHGAERSMEPADILIVTPYNVQIRTIERALAASGLTGFRVGTVDKFQGQEAPAVIYSMATSSADEAPRGLDFLYDPHRLNVATSRAKALAIIVASPTSSGFPAGPRTRWSWPTPCAGPGKRAVIESGALPGAVESGWFSGTFGPAGAGLRPCRRTTAAASVGGNPTKRRCSCEPLCTTDQPLRPGRTYRSQR